MLVLRKHFLVLMALEALAINYYLFFKNWISLVFLGLLCLKLIRFEKLWILIWGIIFGFVWGIYQNDKILRLTHPFQKYHVSSHAYFVYADQIKIAGDLISFEASDCANHQRVKCFYHCKDNIQNFKQLSGKLFISVNADVKMADPPTNENQFNYPNFLYSRNINHIVKVRQLVQINSVKNSSFEDWGHQVREEGIRWLDNLPSPLKNYAKSLILGISSSDFQDTISNIHKLGLTYLFCLSGMHVFFICKYLTCICDLLFVPIEFSNILLLFGLPVYLVIGGNGLSLARAIWMVWLEIFSGFLFKRKFDGIECWSIVLIISLLNQPLTFLSLGSVLSYLMTFIILLSEKGTVSGISFKLNNYSIPLILNATYQYNLLTLFLSVIYGIVFEKIVFPITVIGVFIPYLSSQCNQVIRMNDWIFARLSCVPTVITFGKLPFISVVAIIILMFLLENHRRIFFKLSLIGMIYFISWIYLFFPTKTNVIYFDIGQGDAILVQKAFSHRVCLIDTGGKLNFTRKMNDGQPTMGQKIIANYLLSQGITTISELYLTHQDTDHIGYMTSIGKQINYSRIIVPDGMEKLKSFQKKLRSIGGQQCEVMPVTAQNHVSFFKILHPFKSGKGKNEDSLVLYCQIEKYRFLFMGDLDQKGELQLIKRYPKLKADILKAGHHGSKTSSNPEFIRKISPKAVIISAGRNNRYGHPNLQTIETLESQKIPYFNTAESGMIKVKIGKSEMNIEQ